MAKKELQDIEYAKFKEYIYEIYLRNLDEPDKNIIDEQRMLVHDKFNSPHLDKIFDDTIAFPYDIELFNHLLGMRLNPENLEQTVEKFNIPMELLVSKIKEYTIYPISSINELELMDNELVLKLSRQYIKEKSEKDNKNVDFSII